MVVDIKALDNIIKETISTINQSKEQIYNIAESARMEWQRLEKEINEVKCHLIKKIDEVNKLELEERKARIRLMDVSKDFYRYQEADIKDAYERAQVTQLRLVMLREEEKSLHFKRDHLEISLKRMKDTANRAEQLVSQVSVALQFLSNDLSGVSDKLTDLYDIQQLGLSIIRAQEEERKRVAREIHDGPAQSMAHIIMRTDFCSKLLAINPFKVGGELVSLQQLVRQSLQDLRKIIFDLRPMVLDDLGLVPAVKKYLEVFQTQNNIIVDFNFIGRDQRFDPSIEVAVFRIIQEALVNIKKHAQAQKAIIKMELIATKINVSIIDDGCGFCVDNIKPREDGSGYGLLGMKERIQLLKGVLMLNSTPGKGTEIRFYLPLKN